MENAKKLLELLERITRALENLSFKEDFKKDKSYVIRRKLTQRVKARIKQRDNYKCVRCGSIEKLTIHHVIPISESSSRDIDELIKDNNLVTLCERCHSKVHEITDLERKRFTKYIKNLEEKIKDNSDYSTR